MTDKPRLGWAAWPAGLVVGLTLELISRWTAAIGSWLAPDVIGRWQMVAVAGSAAGAWLAAVGARELARRLGAVRARGAQLAAGGFGVVAATMIVSVVVRYTGTGAPSWYGAQPWLSTLACFAATCGLIGAAGVWRAAPCLGAAVAVAALIGAPPPPVSDLLSVGLHGGQLVVFVLTGATLWTALAIAVIARASAGAAAAPEQNAAAVVGFRRASVALWIRLGSASLLTSAASIELASINRFAMVAGSITGAVSMAIFATALVRVAGSAGAELPRFRLHTAAFCAVWAAIVWSAHALFVYQSVSVTRRADLGRVLALSPSWSVVTAVVAATGIALLLSSIARMAMTSGDDKLARTAGTTFRVFLMITGLSLALEALGSGSQLGEPRFYATLFAASIGVGGLVLAASLCGKAAAAIEARPALATATLRSAGEG